MSIIETSILLDKSGVQMMKNKLRYSALKVALATSLCALFPASAMSDTYTWGSITGPTSDPATCASSPDADLVVFTMIQADGAVNNNASSTDFGGYHTNTCGTLTYDTETGTGSAQIVGFTFAGFVAEAKTIKIDKIPSILAQGNTTFLLANMLFDWNGSNGIPVSIVYDAAGILGEMDTTPTSFTLLDDGNGTGNADATSPISISQTASSPFAGIGAAPASDGTIADFGPFGTAPLAQGPKPMAGTLFDTAKVTGVDGNGDPVCVLGADAEYEPLPNASGKRLNEAGGCMTVNPSADIALAVITDAFDNSANNPTSTLGKSGDPMIDGPFGGFNANFSFDNMKLVSFVDTTAPSITLTGVSPMSVALNGTYNEPGATCTDAAPVGGTKAATVGGQIVDTSVGGVYTVNYDCTDGSGNAAAQVTRTVVVASPGAPLVALSGNAVASHECGVTPYNDASAICVDFEDGAITGTNMPLPGNLFSIDQSAVDAGLGTVGSYTATWSCTDSNPTNNVTTKDRVVNVVDTTKPDVALSGTTPMDVVSSTAQNVKTFTDPGANATDSCDSVGFPLPINAATSGSVNMVVPDTGPDTLSYTLQYSATDASLNSNVAVRVVNVVRSQPVISLVGSNVVLNIGDTYTEEGMDIIDAQQGNLSGITVSGSNANFTYTVDFSAVDTSTTGAYTVTYDVTDSDGNIATQVTRLVTVGIFASGSNFTMLNAQGNVFGGTNDVTFDWDQTTNNDEVDYANDLNFNMTIASQGPFPFFGFVWTAHDTRVFGPGTYSFDTGCTVAEIRSTGCPAGSAAISGPTISMTVGPGQVGAHILFDWNTSVNIDVVNVWDKDGVWDQHGDVNPKNQLHNGQAGSAPDPTTTWKLVSTDVNGDGVNASPMVDGPFQGFYANFNAGPGASAPPTQPYAGSASDTALGGSVLASLSILGMFTGLLTLIGLRRLGKK